MLRHLGLGRVKYLSSFVYAFVLCNAVDFNNVFPVCDVCYIDMYL